MVMVHPLHPLGLDRMGGRPELAAVAAFPLETAFAAVSLMTNGVTERFPKLRILLSHGGGALPWILPRLRHARSVGPPLDSLFPRDPGEMVKSFYYDTILYDDVALDYLVTKVGKERLVVGSDYPFTIKQGRPAEFAEQALGLAREMFTSNAKGLLGLKPRRRLEATLKQGGCSGYLLFLPSILFARASPAAYAGKAGPAGAARPRIGTVRAWHHRCILFLCGGFARRSRVRLLRHRGFGSVGG